MRRLLLAVLLGVAAGLACSDTTAPPQPGMLTIELTTPHASDASILFRVVGPLSGTELTAAREGYGLHQRVAGGTAHVAIFGALVSGTLATFAVPDVARAADYTATVIEVGDESNALRGDLSGYRLTVRR